MDLKLKNKTALITGSTKGIGKAIAIALAREGVHVLINGRDQESVENTVLEIKNKFPDTCPQNAKANLLDRIEREAVINTYPDIDILVNNVGIYEMMDYKDVDEEVLEKYIQTNFAVANSLTKFYLYKMLERNVGRVMFIASEEAVMPSGLMPQYAITKSMLLSLAKSLSKLTTGKDVTVNTIMPGPTLSENVKQIIEEMFQDKDMDFLDKEARFMKENLAHSELQRFIRPDEIGRLTAFLCSPYAGAFKGSPIRMDGGIVPTII
ncbi:SDR family NAD(P)-dependent oxidoreductase [Aureibacillus halotolerans]|uniref:3-oxoacyl-[acyl-carrier protein] reductase n=1 Tax=Aureibacillus halotolerans TaxID=1508390 RepID=A0A4R6U708_9BACI|nr:SDR family oxidoreductase [Aureibacillus halotolerans]TDQ40663.1 3-oxoacyl-[acyl-carrier protein] reductase [Aureibacillus halotolerans]